VISDSKWVWRIAGTYLFTSRSSVMTSSWHGASSPEMISLCSGCVSAWAILAVRSFGVPKPNSLSMISILAKKLVMARLSG